MLLPIDYSIVYRMFIALHLALAWGEAEGKALFLWPDIARAIRSYNSRSKA